MVVVVVGVMMVVGVVVASWRRGVVAWGGVGGVRGRRGIGSSVTWYRRRTFRRRWWRCRGRADPGGARSIGGGGGGLFLLSDSTQQVIPCDVRRREVVE